MDIDPKDIDKVLKLFYSSSHLGKHYRKTVGNVIPEYSTQTKILDHLIEESILKQWVKARDNYIITKNGIDIYENYENYAQYLENEKSSKEEAVKINMARNKTILNNEKLSSWQVKTFWFIFIFGLIGGIYSIYSIIDSFGGESEEQKIERILENILPEQKQKDKASIPLIYLDTLSSAKDH